VYGGSAPIGNFLAGSITEKYGIQKGFILSGVLNLIFILPVIFIRENRVKVRAKN